MWCASSIYKMNESKQIGIEFVVFIIVYPLWFCRLIPTWYKGFNEKTIACAYWNYEQNKTKNKNKTQTKNDKNTKNKQTKTIVAKAKQNNNAYGFWAPLQ